MTQARILSLTACCAGALAAPMAMAGGQAPGTPISNAVTVSYASGGDVITLPGTPAASFSVDQRLSFTFAPLDDPASVNVEPGAATQEIRFLLTNTGNAAAPFDIDLSAIEDQLGLRYDAEASGAEGTYSVVLRNAEGAEGTPYDPTGTQATPALAADGALIVVLRASIPRSASDGQVSAFEASAVPLAPGGGERQPEVTGQGLEAVDIVYGDPGGDGREAGSASYRVLAPQLSAVKDVVVISENRAGGFDCASGAPEVGAEAFVPGACVEYTITLSNAEAASSAATLLAFNDALPETVSYTAIAGNNGFDEVAVRDGVIRGEVGSLAPGASATVRVRATVD
ncbi:hypothetical protein [Roseivivax sp.]